MSNKSKKLAGGMDAMLGDSTERPNERPKEDAPAEFNSNTTVTSPVAMKQKWTTFAKVNALLSAEQKDYLDSLTKNIMRGRKGGNERITSNTILRCLVDLLKSGPLI